MVHTSSKLNLSLCLLSCLSTTAFAGGDINNALFRYETAAHSRNPETYSLACSDLISAAQLTDYDNAQHAYNTAYSVAPQHSHLLRGIAAIGSLAADDGLLMVNTGLHALSSRGDNIFCYATNILMGLDIAADTLRGLRLASVSNINPSYLLVPAVLKGLALYCNLQASSEKRTLTEQYTALLRTLRTIVQEKAPQPEHAHEA